jgi:uncharacterized membrane protein
LKDENTAFEMRAELAKLQKEYLIEMEDVVVVTKNDKGKVKLHQAVNLSAIKIFVLFMPRDSAKL